MRMWTVGILEVDQKLSHFVKFSCSIAPCVEILSVIPPELWEEYPAQLKSRTTVMHNT